MAIAPTDSSSFLYIPVSPAESAPHRAEDVCNVDIWLAAGVWFSFEAGKKDASDIRNGESRERERGTASGNVDAATLT